LCYRTQIYAYPQQAAHQAYLPGSVVIPANAAPAAAQTPIIDYGGGIYAAAPQIQSAYATDVAAATGNGESAD